MVGLLHLFWLGLPNKLPTESILSNLSYLEVVLHLQA